MTDAFKGACRTRCEEVVVPPARIEDEDSRLKGLLNNNLQLLGSQRSACCCSLLIFSVKVTKRK
jgi:hypothetical protein